MIYVIAPSLVVAETGAARSAPRRLVAPATTAELLPILHRLTRTRHMARVLRALRTFGPAWPRASSQGLIVAGRRRIQPKYNPRSVRIRRSIGRSAIRTGGGRPTVERERSYLEATTHT